MSASPTFLVWKWKLNGLWGFFVAIQSGKGLSAMNRRGRIKVNECQKKKKKHKRIDSIQRQEVESLFLTIHLGK